MGPTNKEGEKNKKKTEKHEISSTEVKLYFGCLGGYK
jgi:hypothetical protein